MADDPGASVSDRDSLTMERQRLSALLATAVLDTEPETRFDRIAALAATYFDAPIALISLVDESRQWFKACIGLDVRETPRSWAFCGHAIRLEPRSVLVVEDALADARFADNPLVVGDPHIRFYAGAVLTSADGHNLGTLCVIDRMVRPKPSQKDLDHLITLARLVVDQLELSQAIADLREQQRLLDLAQTMCGVGHWRYDLTSKVVTWSDEVFRIHGLPIAKAAPSYELIQQLYVEDHQHDLGAAVERAIRTGEGYQLATRIRRPDGEVRRTVAKADCVRDSKGSVVALFGVFQDITEQQRALDQIRDSEARYRLLADNITDIILRFGLDGTIRYASPACRQLGYEPDELIGDLKTTLVHHDDREDLAQDLARLAADDVTDVHVHREYRVRRKSGGYVWMEGRRQVIRDAAGRPREVVSVLRDVTARRDLETSLAAAKSEAEAASAIKSEFLANMSHELRTPLTSIIGFSGLLQKRGDLTGEVRQHVQRIAEASRGLLATVNDVLDFSRLEVGQVQIERRPMDPVALGAGVADLLAAEAAQKGLTCSYAGEGLPALVMADEMRLRQILINLVGNAVKFTAKGGVRLEARYDDASQRLRYDVVDTGPGIPNDQRSKLFLRFSQVDGTTTRAFGGTGLGLAICKGLADCMDGEVGVESYPGQGSRFWVEIPCPMGQPAEAGGSETLLSGDGLIGLRVLVVDDNRTNRELTRLITTPFGVVVSEASSGAEGIRLAASTPFDVILMDIRMPEIDGLAATRKIRADHGCNRQQPIIAFSADASGPDWPPGWRDLFDDRLSKPILAMDMLEVLARWSPRG